MMTTVAKTSFTNSSLVFHVVQCFKCLLNVLELNSKGIKFNIICNHNLVVMLVQLHHHIFLSQIIVIIVLLATEDDHRSIQTHLL